MLNKDTSMHSRGFIDTLVSYGIEKSAAERIYNEGIEKDAFGGFIVRGIKWIPSIARSVVNFFRGGGARAASQGVRQIGETAAQVAGGAARGAQQVAQAARTASRLPPVGVLRTTPAATVSRVPLPTSAGGVSVQAVGRTPVQVPLTEQEALRVANQIRASARAARAQRLTSRIRAGHEAAPGAPAGAPAGTPPVNTGAPSGAPSGAPAGTPQVNTGAPVSAQEAANLAVDPSQNTGLVRRGWNWLTETMRKYPKSTALGTMALTAWGVNKLNSNYSNAPERQTINTMTPQESMYWDRLNSGNYLPGMGMDPYYFSSAI